MSSIISKLINLAGNITGILPVANGGTGVATSTGTTNVVLSNSPTLVTPALGAATATSIAVGDNSHTFGVTLNNSTASYSPAVLNYYEEYTHSIVSGDLAVSTGAGTFSSVSGTLRITRIGKIVALTLDQFAFTSASSVIGIIMNGAVPTRFRAASNLGLGLWDVGNGGTGIYLAPTIIQSNGNLQIATILTTGSNTAIANAAYVFNYTGSYTL